LSSILNLFTSKNRQEKLNSNLESETLILSARDSELFVAAIKNPPEPSEGLLSVFE
jgi:uncharacterized protein (DUF1778 family)